MVPKKGSSAQKAAEGFIAKMGIVPLGLAYALSREHFLKSMEKDEFDCFIWVKGPHRAGKSEIFHTNLKSYGIEVDLALRSNIGPKAKDQLKGLLESFRNFGKATF